MKNTHVSSLSRKDKEKRRLQAMHLYQKGISQYRIAKKFDVSFEAVSKWVEAYEKKGADSLKSKGKPGPKSKLDQEKQQKLKKAILKGPKAMGYKTDLWTLERLQALIKKISRVNYHQGHVWKIMINLGFTCQKPQRRAKERNEAAIREWKLETFPRLKKMGV